MALENTHIKIADRIYRDRINSWKVFRGYNFKEYFLFGSFSPDVALYLPEAADFGRFMHSGKKPDGRYIPTNKLAFNILDECINLKIDGNAEKALRTLMVTLGYLTHVATDTIVHPIVYSLSGYYPDAPVGNTHKISYEHWLIEGLLDRLCEKDFQGLISKISEVNWNKSLIDSIEIFTKQIGITAKLYKQSFKSQLALFRSFDSDSKYTESIKQVLNNKIPVCYISFFSQHLELMKGIFPKDPIKYMHPVTGNALQITIGGFISQSIALSTQLIDAALEYYLQGKASTQAKLKYERVIKSYDIDSGLVGYSKEDMRNQKDNNDSSLGNYIERLPKEIKDTFFNN